MNERTLRVIDQQNLEIIQNKNFLIIGLGGVGGSAFESLIRMGIKNITIIDNDTFTNSNLNRQLLSSINNIGQLKVNEALLRAKSINPDINIVKIQKFLDESNFNEIDFSKIDYILDCCDSPITKILLIKESIKNNIKIISCMGTGNRLDPTKLEITNIWQTSNDPLAKKIRKLLKENKITKKIPVVASKEIPIKNSHPVGSTVFVPNVAGIYMANYAIKDILKRCYNNESKK